MQLKLLRQIPSIAPIRAALLVALLQTPHRFRSKRQLWAYSGFAVEVHDSGEYRWVRGKLQRNRERITVRGLNDNHNKDVKSLFKAAAITASTRPGPLHDFYVARVESGMRPTMARLTLARKIAAITLTIVGQGEAHGYMYKDGTFKEIAVPGSSETRQGDRSRWTDRRHGGPDSWFLRVLPLTAELSPFTRSAVRS
jgi:hypothetical protein